MYDEAEDEKAIEGVKMILESLTSKNPARYILNYDEQENDGGITVNQLKNALFKVVKGRDKTAHIAKGCDPKFLKNYSGEHWEFDKKSGIIAPL